LVHVSMTAAFWQLPQLARQLFLPVEQTKPILQKRV
jgi:hypothetical protein